MSPEKQGYADYCAGVDTCPFPPGTDDYESWWNGYQEALEDSYENCGN